MKRILVVSWEMPPLSGPRAVQVTRTLRELARSGWRSRVICFGPRSNRYNQDYRVSPDAETDGAVQLVKVASPEEWLFFRALWRVCPPIKRLPDEKRVWVGRAVAAARRELDAAPADLIVSFAQPWSSHLVGMRLHEETGLPWVAHFSDPWVDSPYLRGAGWQRRLWARMEREVIAKAARVVFVNQQTADRVMAKYAGEWAARARVVPQGYEPLARPPASERVGGPLRIVYTGRFYDGLRTPDAFLRAIAALQRHTAIDGRLAVEFVGGAMQRYERLAADLRLDGVVKFLGRRSPAGALAVASTADVLLSIDAPADGPNLYLPSKLVDYLALGKPILCLTASEGASAELLKPFGYPIVDPTDSGAIAEEIWRLVRLKESGRLTPSPRHQEVARRYDIRETTRRLQAVMEEALNSV